MTEHKNKSANHRRIIMALGLLCMLSACRPAAYISNPYQAVNWDTHGQYKANLHTHTVEKGIWTNPEEVIATYHKYGYTILSLTEHNYVNYPWTNFREIAKRRQKEMIQGGRQIDTTLVIEM
ncbi:MAG: hypothetical protein LRY55_03400 [Leadbetterella sp.]|nr:hypothetical protein [Leadbetterella sp.]